MARETVIDKLFVSGSRLPSMRNQDTGIPALNDLLRGGYPCGMITEIGGPHKSGKTTVLMIGAAAAQRAPGNENKFVLYFDTERKFDANKFVRLGGDPDRILLFQGGDEGPTYDQMAHAISNIKTSKEDSDVCWENVCFVAWDSVGGTLTREVASSKGMSLDDEGNIKSGRIGAQSIGQTVVVGALISRVTNQRCPMVFVNQVRVAGIGSYMTHDDTAGGNRYKHALVHQLWFRPAYVESPITGSKSSTVFSPDGEEVGIYVNAQVKSSNFLAKTRDVEPLKVYFDHGNAEKYGEIDQFVSDLTNSPNYHFQGSWHFLYPKPFSVGDGQEAVWKAYGKKKFSSYVEDPEWREWARSIIGGISPD